MSLAPAVLAQSPTLRAMSAQQNPKAALDTASQEWSRRPADERKGSTMPAHPAPNCQDDPKKVEASYAGDLTLPTGQRAHLIAAAPDLLAALRNFHPSQIKSPGEMARAWEVAREAIAKAEGVQP